MKTAKTIYVLLAILGLLGFASATRAAGIADTKHNLSSSGTGSIHVSSGTSEICVFCHTPHGADTGVAAPLWNRAQTTATFSMYTSPTLDASAGSAPTGTSLACLSCHDGTVAFDAIRNLPGSGGFTNSPSAAGTSTWTFVGTADKKMPAGIITNIGTDLTNDHPISMVYADARSPSSTSALQTAGFRAIVTTGSKKCVGGADCNDAAALPLSSATIGGAADYVQCTSCHDPHRSDTPTFLRKSNAGSALCLTCHVKDG